jgi:ferritin
MEMPTTLAEAFNRQIDLELESSTAYLQMAAYFDDRSLSGFAAWMRVQSEEERAHALKFFDYVLERGNHVQLGSLPAPPGGFDSPVSVFAAALEQERKVSQAIGDLYRQASEAADAASFPLLQWFLEEQVEEEATVSEILDQLRMIGDNGAALLLLDRELGARTAGEDGDR